MLIGIDVGKSYCGVAIATLPMLIAEEFSAVKVNKNNIIDILMNEIEKAEKKYSQKTTCIVVGNPLLRSGENSNMSATSIEVANALNKKTNIKITIIDERFTSKIADSLLHATKKSKKHIFKNQHSLAAMLILQNYISFSNML